MRRTPHRSCLALAGWLAAFGGALADPAGPRSSPPPGTGGWSLERFGTDVTILRATVPLTARGDRGSLILSCAASERRLALTLPPEAWTRLQGTGATPASEARLLFRSSVPDPVTAAFVVARGALTTAQTLVLTETGPSAGSPVVAFVRLLLARPTEIDLLLHAGTGPIGLRRLTAVRLSLSSGSGDQAAFREFIGACTDARGTR